MSEPLITAECVYLGSCLEGFLFGIYSGVFAMYLQYHTLKNHTNKTNNTLFYSMCGLYALCLASFALDVTKTVIVILPSGAVSNVIVNNLNIASPVMDGCLDFVAQYILIYRCWIMWGRNIHFVILPSILTFTFLATWIASTSSIQYPNQLKVEQDLLLTSLAVSMTVNAVVTGLIVLRIFKVFRQVKSNVANGGALGAGRNLRPILFVLIESGMILFSVQLVRLVITVLETEAAFNAFQIVGPIHEMVNGITPTIILVRVSMGLSFHDEQSLEEAAVESLRFASVHHEQKSTESLSSHQDSKWSDDVNIDVPANDDTISIQMVDIVSP